MKPIFTTIALTITLTLPVSSVFAHQWCWCSNMNNTYGWQLMTPEERKAHQARLASFTEYSSCREYVDTHHKKMDERARGRGADLPVMQKSPCDELKERGTVK